MFPNQIFCTQIKSLVIQSRFKSNHNLDLPITESYTDLRNDLSISCVIFVQKFLLAHNITVQRKKELQLYLAQVLVFLLTDCDQQSYFQHFTRALLATEIIFYRLP